mgnify:CR=1 FL=1
MSQNGLFSIVEVALGMSGRGHGEVDCGLLSHCGSPGHSVASHSGPPRRGMASLVAPSNGTDLITGYSSLSNKRQ